MQWLSSTVKSARDHLEQETAGVSSKRERAKIVGAILTGKVAASVSSGASQLADSVTSAHDQLTQRLHERKHQLETRAISLEATHVLHVEIMNASDLREHSGLSFMATCDAYCVAAVGNAGDSWAAKCCVGKATTRVVPRQRNPQWGSRLELQLEHVPPRAELTVRAMDSKTVRTDQPLGEVSIDLSQEPTGACCRQLKCSGFATLNLRWALREATELDPALPQGSPAFEQALALWAPTFAGANNSAGDPAETLAAELRSSSGRAMGDELVMQAPLTSALTAQGRATLLQVLAGALPELSVAARARLAGALVEKLVDRPAQDVNAPLSQEEQFLHDLVRSTTGTQLLEFKRLIGTAGHGIDLVRLVHRAIVNRELQASLLSHFRAEAASLPGEQLHVLSDVDMTFWVGNFGSGGPKFPQGPIPGARPLLRALGGQVTFLTARPEVCESQTRRDLLEAGIAEAGLLPGELTAVLQAALLGKEAHAAMGEKKAQRFAAFSDLHPEASFIFLGDSGEGDVDFAAGCFMVNGSPSRAALIHDVVDETGVAPRTPADVRATLLLRGVFLFDSYADAALRLHQIGMLSAHGLKDAVQGCHGELMAIEPSQWASEAVYLARCSELMCALDRTDEVLLSAGLGTTTRRKAPTNNLEQLESFESFVGLG